MVRVGRRPPRGYWAAKPRRRARAGRAPRPSRPKSPAQIWASARAAAGRARASTSSGRPAPLGCARSHCRRLGRRDDPVAAAQWIQECVLRSGAANDRSAPNCEKARDIRSSRSASARGSCCLPERHHVMKRTLAPIAAGICEPLWGRAQPPWPSRIAAHCVTPAFANAVAIRECRQMGSDICPSPALNALARPSILPARAAEHRHVDEIGLRQLCAPLRPSACRRHNFSDRTPPGAQSRR